jgi:diguanylate cyclase (GGDEF)-like protein/PAS domain S-box-containing protein
VVNLQYLAAEATRAIAYAIVALALWRLFRRRQTAFLGGRRWFVVAALLICAALQFAMQLSRVLGAGEALVVVRQIDACFLLAAAIMVWPFLEFMTRRLARVSGQRLRRHVRRARAQAAQTRQFLELAEEISNVGHWTVSVPGNEVFWSDEIFRIHGVAKGSFIPSISAALRMFHPDDLGQVQSCLERAVAEKIGFEFQARLFRPDGELRYVMSRGVPKLNEADEVAMLFGVFMDLTTQKQAEAQLREASLAAERANNALRELALVDSLTGVANRRRFDTELDLEFRRAAREQTSLGVIMIDLDHFKGYNDLYGHPAGDDCLRQVAQAIARVLRRPGDLLARYGGEEFVVLLPNSSAAGAWTVAGLISEAVSALGLEHLANIVPFATVSCGVAVLAPAPGEHQALDLMRRADHALYQAKLAGRNRIARDTDPPLIGAARVA